MSNKFEKRLAAMEKLLSEIEAKERELNSPLAPFRWGGGLPGVVDLFLSLPGRMKRTEDGGLRMRYLVAMRVALAHFFSLVKKNPDCLKAIDEGQLLELVGVAERYKPKFKLLADWYRANGFTDGKPDRAKLRKLDVPILV
jgi:hypothetical protein